MCATIMIKKNLCITMYDTCDADSLITLSLVNLKFPVTIIILFFFFRWKGNLKLIVSEFPVEDNE